LPTATPAGCAARAKVGSLATGAALAVGIAAAVVLFGLHLLYQQREPRP
jgi:hypothetical protein